MIFAKLLTTELQPSTLLMARSLLGLLLFLPWMFKTRFFVSTTHLKVHVLRSIAFVIGGCALFIALQHLPMSTVVVITYTSPIVICIAATLLFNESLSWPQVAALLVAMVGVNLLFTGELTANVIGITAAVIATLMTVVAQMSLRWLSQAQNKIEILVTQMSLTAPLFLVVFGWIGELPTFKQILMLSLMAASFVVGQVCFIEALSQSELSRLLPLDSVRLLLVALAELLLFDFQIDGLFVLGNILILLATMLTIKAGNKKCAH